MVDRERQIGVNIPIETIMQRVFARIATSILTIISKGKKQKKSIKSHNDLHLIIKSILIL